MSREAPASRHVAVTLAQTAVFWTVFLFVLPALVQQFEVAVAGAQLALGLPQPRLAGGTVFALGGTLGLCSGVVMAVRGRGTPLPMAAARELVLVGPYRLVRNPMAVAGIAQGIGVGLWRDSSLVMLYALAGAVSWHVFVRPSEEHDLEQRFGDAFASYRTRVPLWLPSLRSRRLERALGWLFVLLGAGLWLLGATSAIDLARWLPIGLLALLPGVLLARR